VVAPRRSVTVAAVEIKLTQRLVLASRGFDPRGALPDLDAQCAWFRAAFPAGFDDPAWRRDARGERPPKRAPVGLTRALDGLRPFAAPAHLATQRSALGDDATLASITALLRASRVPWLRGLDELPRVTSPASGSGAWLDALSALLASTSADLATRFDAWVAAHAQPAWPVVTAIPALCDPTRRLFVRPTLLDAQAKGLGRSLARPAAPDGAAYIALESVGHALSAALSDRGLTPRDLVDVALFSSRALVGAQRAVPTTR
jgi:hypothetical protein